MAETMNIIELKGLDKRITATLNKSEQTVAKALFNIWIIIGIVILLVFK